MSKNKKILHDIPTIEEIESEICKRSFFEFFKLAWYILEPNTKLKVNWHHQVMCDQLERIARGIKGRKPAQESVLVINIPFRSSKSIITTILFPVWCWIIHPSMRIITASYSNSLSIKHATQSRDVLLSSWFLERFGDLFEIKHDQNVKSRYENNCTGARMATSIGGAVTGDGGDILICDDPTNPRQADSDSIREATNRWYKQTFYNRVNDPVVGARIIVTQRVHELDLSNYWIGRKRVRNICIPAELTDKVEPSDLQQYYIDGMFWPSHFSKEVLEEYRENMGSKAYQAQMLQAPSPAKGGVLNGEWFKYFTLSELPDDVTWHIVGDGAYTNKETNDPTGLMTYAYHNNCYYIKDFTNIYLELPDLIRYIISYAKTHGIDIYSTVAFEPKATGYSIIQTLKNMTGLNVSALKAPKDSKLIRVKSVAPSVESGRWYLLKDSNWIETFLMQCNGFPSNSIADEAPDLMEMIFQKCQEQHNTATRTITMFDVLL